ncbi:hypothetical protein ACROYT_G010035 [Oculina patagonica]
MARKSFVLKFLLCLVLSTLLLWQLEIKYFKGENASGRFAQTERLARGTARHTEHNQTKPWLIIYWSTFFRRQLNFQLAWKKGECPVACEVTSDRSRANEANGFIVHARDSHMTPSTESAPWILLTNENPVYTPVLTDAKFMSKFNLLISYRLDSDFPQPFYPMPNLTPPLSVKEKDRLIMAAFSNCEPVRTEYTRKLMNFVQVDSYGACLKNKDDLVGRYGSANGKNFKQLKIDLSKKYKFTLVFFNQDCDYFVDDQLSHALDAGSVPVVMSTDKLDEFLPGNLRHAVIKVRDFKSPQHLAEYLKFLNTNETEYNRYLEWKWRGIGNITGTVIGDFWKPKYPLYCQICVALAKGEIHKDGLQPITCKARSYEDWGI